jgi:hypothetical protein
LPLSTASHYLLPLAPENKNVLEKGSHFPRVLPVILNWLHKSKLEDNTNFQTFHICAWLMCGKEELVMSDSRLLG